MAIPSTDVKFSALQIEYGGTDPISISEYYRGGARVPGVGVGTTGIPTGSGAGTVKLSDYQGTTAYANVTYYAVAGGGAGGWGLDDGDGSGKAANGGNTTITGTNVAITCTGGVGGGNGQGSRGGGRTATDGQASGWPGAGGTGGNRNQGGSAGGEYGGGGGAGGGDQESLFDRSGAAGIKGGAGQYKTAAISYRYGDSLVMSIGSGAGQNTGGNHAGGGGGVGRARLKWDGKDLNFAKLNSPHTRTID